VERETETAKGAASQCETHRANHRVSTKPSVSADRMPVSYPPYAVVEDDGSEAEVQGAGAG
jgi:hypothetical protein